jgi:hypothetical protein
MTYLTLVALMLLVVSPVLVPLLITGVHAIGNWRRKFTPLGPIINPERRVAVGSLAD